MEEAQVTVDGVTHAAPRPFMVIATQNPIEQAGTYRLPEAQLDRFLVKTSIGYPDHASTVEILAGASDRDRSGHLDPVLTTAEVAEMIRPRGHRRTSTAPCWSTSRGSPRRPAAPRTPGSG